MRRDFWVLPATIEHLLPLETQADVFALKRTYLFRPVHITSRIVAQDGLVYCALVCREKDKFIPLEKQPRFSDRLAEVSDPSPIFHQDSRGACAARRLRLRTLPPTSRA